MARRAVGENAREELLSKQRTTVTRGWSPTVCPSLRRSSPAGTWTSASGLQENIFLLGSVVPGHAALPPTHTLQQCPSRTALWEVESRHHGHVSRGHREGDRPTACTLHPRGLPSPRARELGRPCSLGPGADGAGRGAGGRPPHPRAVRTRAQDPPVLAGRAELQETCLHTLGPFHGRAVPGRRRGQ